MFYPNPAGPHQGPAPQGLEDRKSTGTNQREWKPGRTARQCDAENEQDGARDASREATLVSDVAVKEPAHAHTGRA